MVDLNNFDHTAQKLDVNNLGLLPEERETTQDPVDKDDKAFKWTQDKDEILINNYAQFESLGKKACFEMLAMLLEGTTARQCYDRGKQLGIKKLSADEARERSRKLLSEESKQLTDKKVAFAVQKFIL